MWPHSKTLEIYSSKQTLQANKSLGSDVNYLLKIGFSYYISSMTWLYFKDNPAYPIYYLIL